MGLRGKAAVVIWTEIDAANRAEHDAWHGTEHLPERLAIPGFRRGRRYAAVDSANPEARFVLYEIDDIGVATSAPYLERLNHPTPWSQKIMQLSRLRRALCQVVESRGEGVGRFALAARLPSAIPMGDISERPGIVAAHVLKRDAGVVRPRTHEESLRRGGVDATAEVVVVIEGTDLAALRAALREEPWLPEAREYALSQVMTHEDLPLR